jgi:murein DD-endopeptidase MepM/ murein hydrolase activator NlpD
MPRNLATARSESSQVLTLPLGNDASSLASEAPASVRSLAQAHTDGQPPDGGSPAVAANPTMTPSSISASDLVIAPTNRPSIPLPQQAINEDWNPPSLDVPLARHPYDHYWFIRPVSLAYTNTGLDYYPYGSNGPGNDLRVHHGIDLSNPIGVEVMAGGDGTVTMAGRGFVSDEEEVAVYGNVVVIEHDLGYEGQPVYTLYAHMSAVLVEAGTHVSTGDVIGLIGATGQVSGPHVHFEVRVGEDRYRAVRNPDLWLAPFAETGVIAGNLRYENGRPALDVDISVVDFATGRTTQHGISYASTTVSSDENWNENFVIPNVPVGRYLVTATSGGTSWSGEVTVLEGMTNWVDMQIQSIGVLPTPTPNATLAP